MDNYHYFDIKLKLRDPKAVVLTPALFRSCVLDTLDSFLCEDKFVLEIVKFCAKQQRVIFRVPEELKEMTMACLQLIGHYQETPCHFQVLESSKSPLNFDKMGETINESECQD